MTRNIIQTAAMAGIVAISTWGAPSLALAQGAGAITIVLPEEPPSLEPCESKHSSIGRVLIRNVTESLLTLNPETGELQPLLATEWEQIDDLTWRFTLREGVTFSDGAVFDAEAVGAALDRLQRTDITCNTMQQTLGGISLEANIVSPNVVDIVTNEPVPILPTMLTVVQMSSPNMELEGASRTPVGTGPYTMDNWQAGSSISVSLRDDYWGETPEVTQATFVWRSESTLRAAMVERGEADIAPVIAAADATNPDLDFAYPNGESTRMRISTDIPPLDDIRVREALNLAVDLEALKQVIGPDAILANQLVPPNVNGFNADLEPFPYDPERAMALLAEARADGVPVDTQITIIGRDEIYTGASEIIEAMQAMWQAVGINTTIRMFDSGNWLRYQNRPFPEPDMPNVHQDQHDNLLGDATFTLFNKYHSEGVNSTLYDDEVDALIEQGMPAVGDERTEAFQAAFARIHDDLIADVFMYHMVGYTRVNPRIEWEPSLATNSELNIAEVRFAD